MGTSREIQARCLCGNYQLSIAVPEDELPLTASMCHCDSCRHGSGTLYIGGAFVPEICVPTVQESLSRLKASQWSNHRTTYLCPTCGATIIENLDGQFCIHTGALDQLEDTVRFKRQIFVKDTQDGGFSHWLRDLPLETHATMNDEMPTDWPQLSEQQLDRTSDRLHAHCLCNGINFWISHPLASSADPNNPKSDVQQHNPDRGEYETENPWWLCENRTKFFAEVCQCNSCRLSSGCDFVPWTYVPTTDISLAADGSVPFSRNFGTLKKYRSSDEASRYFCAQCGATIFYIRGERHGIANVAVGLLNADEGSLAQSWLWWRTDALDFKEDGISRAATLANHVEGALQKWGQTVSASGS
ncbi:hypothetical protein KCU71_g15346, partial [Aureobasidium melanogenum]